MDGRVRGVFLGLLFLVATGCASALDFNNVTEVVENPVLEDQTQVTINNGAHVTFKSSVTITALA
ncbi:MAG: hypothetical protein LUG50_05540, partial [Planctomycetaceae bacterium]|nr:hypothetical protein [Planctomycetaceae bacterium]